MISSNSLCDANDFNNANCASAIYAHNCNVLWRFIRSSRVRPVGLQPVHSQNIPENLQRKTEDRLQCAQSTCPMFSDKLSRFLCVKWNVFPQQTQTHHSHEKMLDRVRHHYQNIIINRTTTHEHTHTHMPPVYLRRRSAVFAHKHVQITPSEQT